MNLDVESGTTRLFMGQADLRLRELAFALLVLVVSSYSWMFSRVSVPNERTRAYLTVALVDHGSLSVDAPLRQFGTVYDLAQAGGHYYTDKAPGSSLLAVPIYAVVRLFSKASDWSIVELCNLFRTWLMLPFGLAGFLLLRSLLRQLGVSAGAIRVSSLAFSLGTPMLHYSNAFYGHVLVAVLVLGALRCLAVAGLLGPREPAAQSGSDPRLPPSVVSDRRRLVALAGAGACAGLAGLIEYQAIVLGVALAIPIAFGARRQLPLSVIAYGAGALPFALLLLGYNARAFGSPFELSYQHLVAQSLQELHGFGLAGATRPTVDVLRHMLASSNRGLILTAPFLAFGLFVLPFLWRRLGPGLFLAAVFSTLYFVLIVSSSSVWYGGWSFGLRLLIPVFGVLALAAAVGFDAVARFSGAQTTIRALALYSVFYHQIVNMTFPELPFELDRPVPDSALPLLHAGIVAPNLGCKLIGLTPISLMPLGLLLSVVIICIAWPEAKDILPARTLKLPRRVLQTVITIAIACGAFAFVIEAEPSRSERDRAGWVRMARGWHDEESSCRAVGEFRHVR